MDFAEFKNTYYPEALRRKSTEDRVEFEGFTAVTKVDWRTKGAVTPVKNQGKNVAVVGLLQPLEHWKVPGS